VNEILDLKKSWLSVARRLQSIAAKPRNGYSIISIKVLTNKMGEAVAWSTPTESRIEPGATNFEQILGLILGELSTDEGKISEFTS